MAGETVVFRSASNVPSLGCLHPGEISELQVWVGFSPIKAFDFGKCETKMFLRPPFFPGNTHTHTLKGGVLFITCDENARVFPRRRGDASVLAVPPAHLPGQTAQSVPGQILRPAQTASAKHAQHSRRGRADRQTRRHVQWRPLKKVKLN